MIHFGHQRASLVEFVEDQGQIALDVGNHAEQPVGLGGDRFGRRCVEGDLPGGRNFIEGSHLVGVISAKVIVRKEGIFLDDRCEVFKVERRGKVEESLCCVQVYNGKDGIVVAVELAQSDPHLVYDEGDTSFKSPAWQLGTENRLFSFSFRSAYPFLKNFFPFLPFFIVLLGHFADFDLPLLFFFASCARQQQLLHARRIKQRG